jgi:hypothetical protein
MGILLSIINLGTYIYFKYYYIEDYLNKSNINNNDNKNKYEYNKIITNETEMKERFV